MSILSFEDYFSHASRRDRYYSFSDPAYKNINLIKTNECQYCHVNCNLIFSMDQISKERASCKYVIDVTQFDVISCPNCGWWQSYSYDPDPDYGIHEHLCQAVLKSYKEADLDLPLQILHRELLKKGDLLHAIHHKKMEQIVGAVFKDFFDAEVHYCGGTGDRGIDLLLIKGEKDIPIQIKRRTKTDSSEGVKTIREMFGVLYRDGYKKACIVTSADHFTKGALMEVNEVITSNKCESFDLIDKTRFLEMIEVTKKQPVPAWKAIFDRSVPFNLLENYVFE